MSPSATTEVALASSASKVGVAAETEKHIHGGEGKTPLEAISQGPLIQPGESVLFSVLDLVFGYYRS